MMMLKTIDVRWFCNTYSSDNTVPSFVTQYKRSYILL